MSGSSDDENDFVQATQAYARKRKRESTAEPRRKPRPSQPSVVRGALLPTVSASLGSATQQQTVELFGSSQEIMTTRATLPQPKIQPPAGVRTTAAPAATDGVGTCHNAALDTPEAGLTARKGAARLSCTPAQPAAAGERTVLTALWKSSAPASGPTPAGTAEPRQAGLSRPLQTNPNPKPHHEPGRPGVMPGKDPRVSGDTGSITQPRLQGSDLTQLEVIAGEGRGSAVQLRRASYPGPAPAVSQRSRLQRPLTPHQAGPGLVPGQQVGKGSEQAPPRAAPPACGCCPVCGCDLGQVSDTATGREAHVNACLDAALAPAAGTGSGTLARQSPGLEPAPPPSIGPAAVGSTCQGCEQAAHIADVMEVEVISEDEDLHDFQAAPLQAAVTVRAAVPPRPGLFTAGTSPFRVAAVDGEPKAQKACRGTPGGLERPPGGQCEERQDSGDATRNLQQPAAAGSSAPGTTCVPGSPATHHLGSAAAAPSATVATVGAHIVIQPLGYAGSSVATSGCCADDPASDPDPGLRNQVRQAGEDGTDCEDFWPLGSQLPLSSPTDADLPSVPRDWDPQEGTCQQSGCAPVGSEHARRATPTWERESGTPEQRSAGAGGPSTGTGAFGRCGEVGEAAGKRALSGVQDCAELPVEDDDNDLAGIPHDCGDEMVGAWAPAHDEAEEAVWGDRHLEAEEPAAEEEDAEEAEDDPVAVWLRRHGLQQWVSRFRDGEVDETVVPDLNDSDLQGLGIDCPDARAAILAAVPHFNTAASAGADAQPTGQGVAASRSSGPPAGSLAGPSALAPLAEPHQLPPHEHPHALPTAPKGSALPPQGTRSAAGLLAVAGPPGQASSARGASTVKSSRAQPEPPAAAGTTTAQPFAAMFRAKSAGPVRITSFFRGGGNTGDGEAPGQAAGGPAASGGPGAVCQTRGPWGRAGPQQQQQMHPAIVQPGGGVGLQAGRQWPQQPGAGRPNPGAQRGAWAAGAAAGGGAPGRLPRWVAECHTIPGTRMLVDFFGPSSKNIPTATSPFRILTHFHADHYKGLTRTFAGGTVLASPVTARLVSERLKLPANKLRVLPMDTAVEVDGVSLTLVDANHCPGAAMVVAQPPGGWPPVLHTGDCRLGEHMRNHPALQALVGRRCTLVLDTTYCDPQYEFPPQRAVLDAVMEAVKAESFNKRALFVFGTYTIGKERLFLEVAAATGQKVYCSKEKAATLAACGLAPQYASLITTNHLEASIHAVPLFKVTLDGLAAILQQYKGRYSAVIGFSPTGWNHTAGGRGGGNGGGRGRDRGGGGGRGGGGSVLSRQQQSAVIGRRVARGTAVVYQVPYSEHSSFGELRSFVSWLQPGRIVPSVNEDGPAGPRTRRMLQLLLGPEGQGQQGAAQQAGPAAGGPQASAAPRDIRAFMKGAGGGGGRGSGGGDSEWTAVVVVVSWMPCVQRVGVHEERAGGPLRSAPQPLTSAKVIRAKPHKRLTEKLTAPKVTDHMAGCTPTKTT